MSVELEELQEFMGRYLPQAPQINKSGDGVGFIYTRKQSVAMVQVIPFDDVSDQTEVEVADIIFAFCENNDGPLNLKRVVDEHISQLVGALTNAAQWGNVVANQESEDFISLSYYRRVRLTPSDLLLAPVNESVGPSELMLDMGVMFDEWAHLNNLLWVMMKNSDSVSQEIDLLQGEVSGSC